MLPSLMVNSPIPHLFSKSAFDTAAHSHLLEMFSLHSFLDTNPPTHEHPALQTCCSYCLIHLGKRSLYSYTVLLKILESFLLPLVCLLLTVQCPSKSCFSYLQNVSRMKALPHSTAIAWALSTSALTKPLQPPLDWSPVTQRRNLYKGA